MVYFYDKQHNRYIYCENKQYWKKKIRSCFFNRYLGNTVHLKHMTLQYNNCSEPAKKEIIMLNHSGIHRNGGEKLTLITTFHLLLCFFLTLRHFYAVTHPHAGGTQNILHLRQTTPVFVWRTGFLYLISKLALGGKSTKTMII